MLKLFRKAFWVPYEDSAVYPDLIKTIDAISKYCEQNGDSCTFTAENEVEINGKKYEISRELFWINLCSSCPDTLHTSEMAGQNHQRPALFHR